MQETDRDAHPPACESAVASSEQIMAALDSLGSSGKLDTLAFLGEQLHAEQSHYWNRFAAFAALQAGLLVVAVETSGWARVLTALLGVGLAVVWLAIQKRSREYVDRWKPAFHLYRRAQKLFWSGESIQTLEVRKWSSTKLAELVPWALLLPWFILVVLALVDMRPNTPLQPTSGAEASKESTQR